jgi:glycosyltransferase involved in cell wall biosynthesis
LKPIEYINMLEYTTRHHHALQINSSIVIASLGGGSLDITLDSIINGSYVPHQIIVVLPPHIDFSNRLQQIRGVKIHYYNSLDKGQVVQRLFGLTKAHGKIVIQSDDDIKFHVNCLRDLVEVLSKLGNKNAIAPMLYDETTFAPLANYVLGKPTLLRRIIFFIHGVSFFNDKLGNISKAGYAFLPILYENQDSYEVQWLPGGVVASWRDDLILKNYFPFSGKAYCEDLFNSIERSKSGIKQIIYRNIYAYTRSALPMTIGDILADHKVRINLVRFWRWPQYYSILFGKIILLVLRRCS